MFKTIVRKEIAADLLSYKFFIVIGLASLLIFTGLFVMARDYKARMADYDLIKPKPGDPIAVLAPNPLSVLVKGLDEAMTRSFEVESVGIEVRAGQQSGNAVFAFFPAPDFLYIVKVVLSLVALLFGFDQISRERENGTLKLMFANPVSRAAVLAGKWLAHFLTLAVPFLIVTLLGLVVLALDPGFRLREGDGGRLALLLGICLAYVALFLSLGFLISAITRRSASTLVVLLLAWAGLVFILPNLGTLVARQAVDVPSVRSLSEKRAQIWTREVLLSLADRSTWDERIRTMNEEFDRLTEDYRVKFEKLVRLSKNLNRLSPAAGFVYAATEIAGTGIGEESRLKQEVIRYKNRVLEDIRLGRKDTAAFSYRYRPIGRVLAEGGLVDIAWLVILAVFLFAAGFAAFVRYDVR
jgi:ABC-type transport system involved in multi-copper enzyme maturation permease subunit